jgi:hypothetical protein
MSNANNWFANVLGGEGARSRKCVVAVLAPFDCCWIYGLGIAVTAVVETDDVMTL